MGVPGSHGHCARPGTRALTRVRILARTLAVISVRVLARTGAVDPGHAACHGDQHPSVGQRADRDLPQPGGRLGVERVFGDAAPGAELADLGLVAVLEVASADPVEQR